MDKMKRVIRRWRAGRKKQVNECSLISINSSHLIIDSGGAFDLRPELDKSSIQHLERVLCRSSSVEQFESSTGSLASTQTQTESERAGLCCNSICEQTRANGMFCSLV